MQQGSAFLTPSRKAQLDAAYVSYRLLEKQQLLMATALCKEDIAWLDSYASSLNSTASAAALNKDHAEGKSIVSKRKTNSERILRAMGLEGGVSSDAVSSSAFFVEVGTTKVRYFAQDSTEHAAAMENKALHYLGSAHMRRAEDVFFSMLRNATEDNFYVEHAPEEEGGESIYTAAATAMGWKLTEDAMHIKFTQEPEFMAATAAAGLEPTMAGVVISRDATLVQSSHEYSLVPTYITSENFTVEHVRLFGSSALWSLTTTFLAPESMKKDVARLYRRLFSHACADLHYRQLHELRHGVLWELAPNNVRLLVPRALWRAGDWPERKGQLMLMAAATAGRPCSTCTVPRCGVCSTIPSALRSPVDIRKHALVPPFVAYGGAKADIAAAKAAGSTPSGRPPAPLTREAIAITGPVKFYILSPPDVMHCVRMLARTLQEALLDAARGAELMSAELERRRAALLCFSSAASRFRPPTAEELRRGKKLPIDVHVSSLLVLHGLLEGAWGADEAAADVAGTQMFLLLRFISYLSQSSLRTSDVRTMGVLSDALTRALRVIAALAQGIKAHEARHIAPAVPLIGPPAVSDTVKTESMHNLTKCLAERVGRRPTQLRGMLLRANMQLWVNAALDAQRARAVAVARGAGAGGAPVNLAGALASPFFVPPLLPPLLRAEDTSQPALGGFIAAVSLTSALCGGPPRRVPGVRSQPPGLRPGPPFPPQRADPQPDWLRAVAEFVLYEPAHLGAPYPLSGSPAARAAEWLRGLREATCDNPKLRLPDFDAAPFSLPAKMRMTLQGAAALCTAVGARVHTHLRVFYDNGGAPKPHGPPIRVRNECYVSFGVPLGDVWDATRPGGGIDEEGAGGGGGGGGGGGRDDGVAIAGFAMGRVVDALSIPPARELRLGAGPREAALEYLVLELWRRDHDAEAAQVERVPSMEGMVEPWVRVEPCKYVVLPTAYVLRCEHVQPRYGADVNAPLSGAAWRYPIGGMSGRLATLPLPEGAEDVDAEVEKSWLEGRGGMLGGSVEEEEAEEEAEEEGEVEGEEEGEEEEEGDADSVLDCWGGPLGAEEDEEAEGPQASEDEEF